MNKSSPPTTKMKSNVTNKNECVYRWSNNTKSRIQHKFTKHSDASKTAWSALRRHSCGAAALTRLAEPGRQLEERTNHAKK
jgi:hypothetical protein